MTGILRVKRTGDPVLSEDNGRRRRVLTRGLGIEVPEGEGDSGVVQ